MISALIAGALVGIVSILIGSFSELSAKVVWSIATVALHSIFSFYIIPDNGNQQRINRLKIFYETSFVLLVLSFVTSLLGIWETLGGDITAQLYGSYLVVFVASMLVSIQLLFVEKTKNMMISAVTASISTIVLAALFILAIFVGDELPEFYFRLLAVLAIISGTSSVVTAVLYKIYYQSHPEEENLLSSKRAGGGILRMLGIIVLVIIGLNFIAGLFIALLFTSL